MNWRRFLRRDNSDAEQREELELYIDLTAEEYLARGLSPDEARAAARRKLGNPILIREEVYRMNTLTWVESVCRDLRYALRMIRTKPGFSVPALLSLALGIGANIAIFSVVDAVLIRPLPYPEPQALIGVYNSGVFSGQAFNDVPLSLGMFAAYEKSAQSFEEFGVWTPEAATVTGLGDPEHIAIVIMTQGVFRALGVRPYLGRWFETADEKPGAPKTMILSYGYWQRKFGGDPRVVGQVVLMDFIPRQVIGVMPPSFQFLDLAPNAFLPQTLDGQIRGDEFNHSGIARLKPGVTLAQANSDIVRVLRVFGETSGDTKSLAELRFKPSLRPLKQDVVGDIGSMLGILMGALVLVLLLVCANVANLVQVRAQARRQEFAIRAALGAGWSRIARELLVESVTLGVLGGAVGLGLAYAGIRFLVTSGIADFPRLSEISIDATAILFALACSLAASILFGSIALLKSARVKVQNARGATISSEQLRTGNVLVVTQVGLALVLLIAAGLMVRSFLALRSVKPGFTHPEQIETVRLAIPSAQVREPQAVAQMQADIVNRLAAIPGVSSVAFGSALPLDTGHHNGNLIGVEGKTSPGRLPPNRTTKRISPGFFATLGTRLLAGRDFTWDDFFGQRRVAIVSENMAREYWGEPANAIGKRLRNGNEGPWNEIVGVVENVYDDGVQKPPPATVYFRAGVLGSHAVARGMTFAIRSNRAGTEGFLREVSAAIHGVNASLPLAELRTLNDVYRLSMARTSFVLVLLGISGMMALTLAVIGVYGVLAYAVAQRSREVSIRVALGAEPGMVKALFVKQGLMLVCAGGAIGLLAAAALSRWIASLLFGVTPLDAATYGASAAVIVAAAMAASYIPARRAARVDPMESLRSD